MEEVTNNLFKVSTATMAVCSSKSSLLKAVGAPPTPVNLITTGGMLVLIDRGVIRAALKEREGDTWLGIEKGRFGPLCVASDISTLFTEAIIKNQIDVNKSGQRPSKERLTRRRMKKSLPMGKPEVKISEKKKRHPLSVTVTVELR